MWMTRSTQHSSSELLTSVKHGERWRGSKGYKHTLVCAAGINKTLQHCSGSTALAEA